MPAHKPLSPSRAPLMTTPRQDDCYPERPGWKAPGASQDAAEAMAPAARQLASRALAVIEAAGPAGLTADECAAKLGVTLWNVRPRVSELHRRGDIEPTGERRKSAHGRQTATVWRKA